MKLNGTIARLLATLLAIGAGLSASAAQTTNTRCDDEVSTVLALCAGELVASVRLDCFDKLSSVYVLKD